MTSGLIASVVAPPPYLFKHVLDVPKLGFSIAEFCFNPLTFLQNLDSRRLGRTSGSPYEQGLEGRQDYSDQEEQGPQYEGDAS